jgi:hypothetical protein
VIGMTCVELAGVYVSGMKTEPMITTYFGCFSAIFFKVFFVRFSVDEAAPSSRKFNVLNSPVFVLQLKVGIDSNKKRVQESEKG